MSEPSPPSSAAQRIARRVRALRASRSLTLEALATRAGLPLETVNRVELLATSPSLRTLERIAAGLDVDLSELLAPPSRPSPPPEWAAELLSGRSTVDLARARRVLTALFDGSEPSDSEER